MVIEVQLVKGTYKSFTSLLNSENIEFSKRFKLCEINPYETIQVVGASAGAISAVLIAWIRAKQNRKVVIKTNENKIIQVQGFSEKDTAKIIESAKLIEVIESDKNQ